MRIFQFFSLVGLVIQGFMIGIEEEPEDTSSDMSPTDAYKNWSL